MPQYKLKFTDDATSTLATAITAASTAIQLVSGGGALFPALGAGEAFVGTLVKSGSPSIKEIVLATARAGDSLTVSRNYGGTGALIWQPGDTFALLQPAEALAAFAQIIDLQSQKTNYANDTGAVNAYVANLTPALNGHVIGMPIRWIAAHTNTGASTFSDGISTAALTTMEGAALTAGVIVAGLVYECFWNGSYYQLSSIPSLPFAQLIGSILNSQVPFSAVAQWESSLIIAFSQLTGQLQNGQVAASIALPGSPTTTTQSVNDSSAKIATTAFANPGASVSIPGYFRTPSGFLVQLGTANPAGGAATVTLPVTYPSAYLAFGISIAGGAVQTWIDTSGKTNSQFVLRNSGGTAFWMTIGY